MMMSPTALIDTAGPGALPGAPGEVDNGAPDVGGGVRPAAADVPLCPPAVVHAAVSNDRMSSTDTRRRREERLANAERRAASMLILWALADGGTGRVADRASATSSFQHRHTFAILLLCCPSTAADAKRPIAAKHSRRPFDVLTELHSASFSRSL